MATIERITNSINWLIFSSSRHTSNTFALYGDAFGEAKEGKSTITYDDHELGFFFDLLMEVENLGTGLDTLIESVNDLQTSNGDHHYLYRDGRVDVESKGYPILYIKKFVFESLQVFIYDLLKQQRG